MLKKAQWLLRRFPSRTVAGAAPDLNRLPISFCWMISGKNPEMGEFKGLGLKIQDERKVLCFTY